ncbi:MAG: ABC transporter permease [Candidatus Kariarchaeaceae archaeon]
MKIKKANLIFKRCMKQTFRNAGRLSIIFLIPVLFIVGIAWLYGDESSFVVIGDTGDTYSVGVINKDRILTLNSSLIPIMESFIPPNSLEGSPFLNGFGTHFIENSNGTASLVPIGVNKRFNFILYSDSQKASTAIQSRFISMCIIIPENFSQTLIAGLNYRVNVSENILLFNSSNYYYSESTVEIIGDYTYARFSEAFTLLQEMLNAYLDNYWMSGIDQPGKMTVEEEHITTLSFTEFDIYVPAFLIFTIISSSTGVAGIIGYEREDGTIDRLKLSKFTTRDYLVGLSFTQILTSILTMIVIIPTIFFLGFPFQGLHQGFYVLLMTILATLPLLGISLGFAAITDGQMSTYLPSLIAIPMSFLTGNFIPLPKISLIGDVQLWHINPFFSAGELLRKTLIVNLDFNFIIIDLIMLILVGIIFFVGGSYLFLKSVFRE